jgi:hypothetical protein
MPIPPGSLAVSLRLPGPVFFVRIAPLSRSPFAKACFSDDPEYSIEDLLRGNQFYKPVDQRK